MYMPTTLMYQSLDPIEEHRLGAGRPASRMEIARRVLRTQHEEIISGDAPVEEMPATFVRRAAPGSMTRVRRGIGRVLNAAADRIAPEAA